MTQCRCKGCRFTDVLRTRMVAKEFWRIVEANYCVEEFVELWAENA